MRRHKRLVNSLAYTALVAVVAGLGYLTLKILESPRVEDSGPPPESAGLIELEGFQARPERSGSGWILRVSLRLRAATAHPLDCQVFLVAKGEPESGKLFQVWPTIGPGTPFSAAGHLTSGNVSSGAPLTLTQSWQRIVATIPLPTAGASFHTVTVYVFGPRGEVLLSRPFSVAP